MDINDIIIIKLIVTYYCMRVCSIQLCEAVAHAQTVHPKLKPRLLQSNRCHVLISLCLLSLNSWLTKLQVLFVIREDNLCSRLTLVDWAHPVCIVSQEPWTGYGYNHEIQYKHCWHCQSARQSTFLELQSWWLSYCKTRGAGISYSPSTDAVLRLVHNVTQDLALR